MPGYHSLPSIYLGTEATGRILYDQVRALYERNRERFPSYNQFLRYLIAYAVQHDQSLNFQEKESPGGTA